MISKRSLKVTKLDVFLKWFFWISLLYLLLSCLFLKTLTMKFNINESTKIQSTNHELKKKQVISRSSVEDKTKYCKDVRKIWEYIFICLNCNYLVEEGIKQITNKHTHFSTQSTHQLRLRYSITSRAYCETFSLFFF